MATNKTSDGLPINSPPTYGSQDVENPPIPQESPPPYLPSPAPPPSYHEVVKKIRRTREESDNYPQFFRNLAKIIAGTFGCTIILGIVVAIPISMIVIGAIYKDQCPAQPKIPIYLIVMGAFGIYKNLKDLLGQFKNRDADENDEDDQEDTNNLIRCFDGLVMCFLFAWFIAGNVWIYSIYKPPFDHTNLNYCNQTLYLFAFWITTSGYIFIGLLCVCCCCLACSLALVTDS